MSNPRKPEKLVCPCCGKPRSIVDTPLQQIEAEWSASSALDARRSTGWSIEAARVGQLQWACLRCLSTGRALPGRPAEQTWCDYNPYFAYFDVTIRCGDCEQAFVFAASEQQFWYEKLKFWVQSRPKQCISCRRARRADRARPPEPI